MNWDRDRDISSSGDAMAVSVLGVLVIPASDWDWLDEYIVVCLFLTFDFSLDIL